jgi:hypothetical protein
MPCERREHLRSFYSILDGLESKLGGARKLADCSGQLNWPRLGVYYFREHGEVRSDSGFGPRIVRIGTHALKEGARTTLWSRISQHRGLGKSGGGNHRGSIFRLLLGAAIIARDGQWVPTWGKGSSASATVRACEASLECAVSKLVREMHILWLAIHDEPQASSLRGYIERNSIALLSNFGKPPLDSSSAGWLGRHCDRDRIRHSGLWNSNHVDEQYDPAFLNKLAELVAAMERPA